MCVSIVITYSPIKPSKKIWNDAKKKKPIIIGAIPRLNELQYKIFANKYTSPRIIEMKLAKKPTNVINLNGILECFIIPNIPKSYKV